MVSRPLLPFSIQLLLADFVRCPWRLHIATSANPISSINRPADEWMDDRARDIRESHHHQQRIGRAAINAARTTDLECVWTDHFVKIKTAQARRTYCQFSIGEKASRKYKGQNLWRCWHFSPPQQNDVVVVVVIIITIFH